MSTVNTQTQSLQNTESAATSHPHDRGTKDQVSPEDAHAFAKTLNKKTPHSGQAPSHMPYAFDEKKATQGEAILAGMLGQEGKVSTGHNIPTNAPTQSSSARTELSPDIMNKLVDSILVSATDAKQEVLIKVQNTVLPDTQIMVRMDEGKLFVDMQTHNADSSLTLHQHMNSLRERLQSACKETEIFVKVTDDTTRGGNNEDSSHRSRGHFLWNDVE